MSSGEGIAVQVFICFVENSDALFTDLPFLNFTSKLVILPLQQSWFSRKGLINHAF